MKHKNEFKENPYKNGIRIKPEKLIWLKLNKGKKSAAAFLDEILEDHRKPNLFKKHK